MYRSLVRLGALAGSGMLVAGALVLGAGAASAAPVLGTLSVTPATGLTSTNFSIGTSAGCPATDTRIAGVVNATGWSNVTLVSRTSNGLSTGPMTVGISDNLFNIASANGLTLNPGKYAITLYCLASGISPISGSDGEFDGAIYVTGTATQGLNQPYQSTNPNLTPSTTTLGVTPTGSALAGQNVTLTAAVAPNTATGTVTFNDGGVAMGTPVAVTAGSASLSTTTLAAGAHSFTASYSGDSTFASSVSAATPYTIGVPLNPTTTSLSAPATLAQFSPATFNVTTTPATSSGSVTLTEGGSTIGTGTVTNGAGTVTTTFTTQGSHTVVANFSPTGGTLAPSSSQPVTVTVGASQGVSAGETIETTIAAGSLTISVSPNPTVVLPSPTLDPTAGLLVTSGAINTATVTDTRAGAPGFTVSGIVTDFSNGAATPSLINGYNLGWSPAVGTTSPGMSIALGPVVDPAPGIAPGATPANAAQGLKSLRTLATDAAGGLGTVKLGAIVKLQAPTSTPAGTYDATLTLTAI